MWLAIRIRRARFCCCSIGNGGGEDELRWASGPGRWGSVIHSPSGERMEQRAGRAASPVHEGRSGNESGGLRRQARPTRR